MWKESIRMISDESCDTQDVMTDGNSAYYYLQLIIILKYIKIEKSWFS